MIRRLLTRIADRLPARCIPIGGEPYLFRYYLGRVFGVTFYLHEFVRADAERWLHDHPWRLSLGVVLAGEYVEERMTGLSPYTGPVVKQRRVRWLNIITGSTAHRITEPRPGTWTLFIHTRKKKAWGFYEFAQSPTWRTPANDNIIGADSGVVYHQPFPSTDPDWHLQAPRGADLKREIYARRDAA